MDKVVLDSKKVISLAKIYKKVFETYSVKRYAYLVNENPMYFCRFNSKHGEKKIKGYAILSPTEGNEQDQMKSLAPLVHYSVSIHNIIEVGEYRSNLNFAVFHEVKEYLNNIVNSNILENDLSETYKRSLLIVENMIICQQKLEETYKEAMSKYNLVKEKGYITDDDISEVKSYIPMLMWLQYKQYIDRYVNRKDFDLIFENKNKKEIKKFEKFSDPDTLKQMTTNMAEQEMKEGLSRVTYNKDLRGISEDEYNEIIYSKFNSGLDDLIEEVKNNLRNP